MGFLSSLTGSKTGKATMQASDQNKDALFALRATGNKIIADGENKSRGALDQAIGAYQPWVDSGTAANSLYGDALGLNGTEGNARATGAFQAGPGFQFALDQGTQVALRGASAAGMLSSGNTMAALQDRGNGLANQEYGGWLSRLSGVSTQGQAAAGGQAQGYSNIANLYQNSADDQLSLESGVTQGLQGANNQWATGMEANNAARGSFLGKLLNGGVSALTGGKVGGLF